MAQRIINRHGPLGAGQLPARYRRLRYAEHRDDRLVDADEGGALVWDDDDYWPRLEQLDVLWHELSARVGDVAPFNPVLSGRCVTAGRANPVTAIASVDQQPLEERLASHYCQLPELDSEQLLGGDIAPDLYRLAQAAREHFAGSGQALVSILLFRPFWVRPPRTWRSPARGKRAVVNSLVEHVFVQFSVPSFLLNAWREPAYAIEPRWLTWLIVLGQGGSLRRLNDLVLQSAGQQGWGSIAKKLPARLSEVPAHLSAADGVMFAEVARLGGSELEYARLSANHSYRIDPSAYDADDGERRFWEETVRWLVRFRDELDDDACALILAWARHCYTEQRGERFSWKGRTCQSAHREARSYVATLYSHRNLRWRSHHWDWDGHAAGVDWSVRELTSSQALLEESIAMSHCVRLYDLACHRGASAIFSLRRAERRCLTIELEPRSGRVAQIRGAYNRCAGHLEKSVVAQWLSEAIVVEKAGLPDTSNSA